MKRYIRSTTYATYIPEPAKKYYKIQKDMEQWEIDELTESFDYNDNLEFIAPLEAKSSYYGILEDADIAYVSLCRDKDGNYGVYALTSGQTVDITKKIPYIIDRVRRDLYQEGIR